MRGLRAAPAWIGAEGREQLLLCPACQDRTDAFDRARSFAVYQNAVVRAILLLKFEQIEPLGAWFEKRLAEMVGAEGDRLEAEVVVPVPLHRERERERGYNQGALLSKPLAKRLRLPHKAVLLMRTRARADKQALSLENDGRPCVALLPHVRASKLTIYASYW